MMVPQLDSSGQITGYGIDIPTTIAPQSDGSTLYTFASGVTYSQAAAAQVGPLVETANSGENVWTIPEATSGTATFGLFGDGSYSEAFKDNTSGLSVAEVYIAGTSGTYTVTSSAQSTFITDCGTSNQVTAGAGSFVDLVGNADRTNVSNATVLAEANTASVVSGNSNTVTASGINVGVTLLGNNDVIQSAIANDGFAATGTNEVFNTTGDGITFNSGSSGTVNGNANSIAAASGSAAASVHVLLFGNGDIINSAIENDGFAATGTNEVFNTTGDGITFNSGSGGTVNGNANSIAAASGSAAASVHVQLFGNGDIINSAIENDGFAVTGTSEVFNTTGDGITFNSGSSGTVNGNANSIAAASGSAAASVHVQLFGNGDIINSAIENDGFAVTGTSEVFNTTGDGITFNSGSSGTVNGNANSIAAAGGSAAASVHVQLFGNGDIINSAIENDGFAVTGTSEVFNTTGDGITFNSGSSGTVNGNANSIAAASGSTAGSVHVTMVGNGDNITSTVANDGFAITGLGETFNTTGDGITLGQNSGAIVSGNSNSIAAGTNCAVAVNGSGNIVNAGSNSVILDNGVNNTINATNSVIQLGSQNIGRTIYINGNGNTIDASTLFSQNPTVQADIVVRGTGNTIVANNQKIDLTGTSGNFVTGNNAVYHNTSDIFSYVSGASLSGTYGPLNPSAPSTPGVYFPDYDPSVGGTGGSFTNGGVWNGDPDIAGMLPAYDLPLSVCAPGVGSYSFEENGTIYVIGCSSTGDDPIILNLDGSTVQTTSLATSTASFDMQNNGQAVQTGWGTAGEGYLVFDPNDPSNTAQITQDSQLVSGFGALQSLAEAIDGAGTATLTASDALWTDLKVWVDTTGTGQFESGQLYSLSQLGITSINLDAGAVNLDSNGNQILTDSTFTRADGSTGDIAGVNLMYNGGGSTTASLADMQVQNLISAMASFGAGTSAVSTFVASAQNDPTVLLAASA